MDCARFQKRARLLKPAEFKHVFNSSIRSSDRYLTILASPNQLGYARLGMAISKKCSKSAVVRNRIKRLIRESFRQRQQNLIAADFVVLARPVSAKTENPVLLDSLDKLWTRLNEKCGQS